MLSKVLEIEDDVQFVVDDLNKKMTAARKQPKLIQRNAAVARDTHLEELAQQTTIKNIQHCEELKLAFTQMKPITKDETGGTVRDILALNKASIGSSAICNEVFGSLGYVHTEPYALMDDPDEVIDALIKHNKLHLHQAFGAPFTMKTMHDYVRNLGTGQGAQDILAGKFDPNIQENLPAVNFSIKHHLQRVAVENSININ
eukprot:974918-Ditylum_brightwellii.AAC.1